MAVDAAALGAARFWRDSWRLAARRLRPSRA